MIILCNQFIIGEKYKDHNLVPVVLTEEKNLAESADFVDFATGDHSNRLKGECVWWNVKKGFGFIVPCGQDGQIDGERLFCHKKELDIQDAFKKLNGGDLVF